MIDTLAYEEYLDDSSFVKYGIVISHLVWGKSYSQIAEAFSISKPYVSKIMTRWRTDGSFEDRRQGNGGSNKKNFAGFEEEVIRKVQQTSTTSLRSIANELNQEMEIEVSHKKVGRFLKELDYVKTKPISIPVLTNSALDKRFEYAKSHINDRFWNVCFTDESVFQLNDNRQMVWWSRSDEMRPVVEMKSDRRKVMVWGGISRKGQTPLFF